MHLAGQISFWLPYIGIEIILIVLLFFWFFKREIFKRIIKITIWAEIGLLIFAWASQIVLTYFALKNSELGPYLVSGKNSYFLSQTIYISQEYLWIFLIAILFYLLIIFLAKKQKKPRLDENAAPIFFITILAFSSIRLLNFIPGLIFAFLIAVVWQLSLIIFRRAKLDNRIAISPCLITSAIILQVLSLFPFYLQFLVYCRLI